MTVEEHVSHGGLGMEIARIVAESGNGKPFRMLTIPAEFPDACYDRASLLARSGLDADSIATAYNRLCLPKTDRDD
jgi:transketolase C-terminal domain/subunit